MKKLQSSAATAIGLFLGPTLASAQTAAPLPQPPFAFGQRASMPMMKGGCCAMHMGMKMQNPPTGLQALQQAFNLLYSLDAGLPKGLSQNSAVRAVHDDVKAIQQAAQTKDASLSQRQEMTLAALHRAINDLQTLQADTQVPAATRQRVTAVVQQLQQLHELGQR